MADERPGSISAKADAELARLMNVRRERNDT
jgi:hypothetical protein